PPPPEPPVPIRRPRLSTPRQPLGDTAPGLLPVAQRGLAFYQAIALTQAMGDRQEEKHDLLNIGTIYLEAGQAKPARDFHERYLDLIAAEGSRLQSIEELNRLGEDYAASGQHPQALNFYQRALNLNTQLQADPNFASLDWQGVLLGNMGASLAAQNSNELAIAFYKAAINAYETVRAEFTADAQISQAGFNDLFLIKHQSDYRNLADLLLQSDRILEAQQVLDLLKVQELEGYLRDVRSSATQLPGVEVLQPEQSILKQYNQQQTTAIALGQELSQLREIPAEQRTSDQQQQLTELVQLERDINAQFNTFIESEAIQSLVDRLSRTAQRQNLNLEDLNALRDQLRQYNAALLYPLILEDRLELVITTPNSPPLRRTIPIDKARLNKAIVRFRQQLARPGSGIQPTAQLLHEWLIAPIQADLEQAGVETIIYAPDGALRYIPLAALHDGQRWLTETYQINHITARSLSDFDTPRQEQLSVLAGAFATGEFKIALGQRNFSFAGLPFAAKEVEVLTATLPNSTKLIDQDFNLAAILPRLNDHSIVHFATHATFVTGQPEASFIVFGNGDRATLNDIKNWSMSNVDMVVLSACETGVGGFGSGEEILGLGYQFQRAGARATIASLWAVDDQSTQELMVEFYQALGQGATKIRALQQAQQRLLTSEFNHPYYWAPFILIGNGL
ncbi:MAG: CHAT domain-containing protein, partial [Cyanobacteria bacterium P01_H01_bin.121]